MKFTINNIGKIVQQEFDLKGITVFVGDNNTGKTTVGKCLYAFFSSLYQIDDKVIEYKREGLASKLRRFTFNYRRRILMRDSFTYANKLLSEVEPEKRIEEVRDFLRKILNDRVNDSEIDQFLQDLLTFKKKSNGEIRKLIVKQWFVRIFTDQYVRMDAGVDFGSITANVCGHPVSLEIGCDRLRYDSDININQRVYFIKDSSLLKNPGYVSDYSLDTTLIEKVYFSDNSLPLNENSEVDKLFDKEEIDATYAAFSHYVPAIIKGDFVTSEEDDAIRFKEEGLSKLLEIENVSEGLKQFGVIGMLISKRVLRRGDILILDEPEVHLHPTWQMKYAELIVLLQKELKLHVVISTHSSDFVDALRLYAKKYGSEEFLNAYIASLKAQNEAQFEPVDVEDWDRVFNGFVKILDLLYNLRKELGE